MRTSSSRNNTFEGNNVPTLTKILFPWSGIFRDACYALIGTFLMQYAITSGVLSSNPETFKAQYGVITVAMIIALVWDGINDPIMGFILEKCHFKSGKFRPWIEIGAIGNAAVVICMFLMPALFSGLRGWGYVVFMIVMYVLWDAFFSMNDIGYWSMLPALTNDAGQRAKLTTYTAIAASVGTFIMNIMMFVLPGMMKSVIIIYEFAAIGVATLFLASQTAIYFFCKEKVRDAEQEEISENSSIIDLFRVVKKNKQLLYAALGMLLYYLGSFILTGIGQNYFYMVYGYGGAQGGMVATVIAAFYVLATVVSQAFYPMLAKRFKKKQILTASAIVIFLAYLGFFFIAFPVFGEHPIAWNTPDPTNGFGWVFGGTMSLLYVMSFLFFGASGIFYLAVLVMFQDAIDYGELTTGERKESICFAWRPLDVKIASGLNRGLQYLVYVATGTYAAINIISTMEGDKNAYINTPEYQALSQAEKDAYDLQFVHDVDDAVNASRASLVGFGAIVIGVILLVFAGSYILCRFCYKLDEDKIKEVVAELEAKHAADKAAREAEVQA